MLVPCHFKRFIHRSLSTIMSATTSSPPILSGHDQLWQLIQQKYDAAQQSQASTLTETNVQIIQEGNVNFILRIAAKLLEKPKAPKVLAGDKTTTAWQNPFLPPDPALFITHLSTTHSLLLNKFNIVPHHVLVVTRDFQLQTDPLNSADLAATWQTLQAMPLGGLAYYNSGPISGASQPHKHMQVVPLPLAEGYPPVVPLWTKLVNDGPTSTSNGDVDMNTFPCVAFGSHIQAAEVDSNPETLEKLYLKLLDRTKTYMSTKTAATDVGSEDTCSYNFLMTKQFMLIVPRKCEYDGPVGCNSVAFAGSFFVRSKEELDYVCTRGPINVLKTVGWEW